MARWEDLRSFLATGGKKKCSVCEVAQHLDCFYDPYTGNYGKRCNKCIAEGKKVEVVKDFIKKRFKKFRRPFREVYKSKKIAISNAGNRTRRVLKRFGITSDPKTMFGCTIEELIVYLEAKFTDGMTWDNYGNEGWHIDHIRPCASFDLIDPEQQKQCFHYTNLQPLWAKDNLRKSSKWEGVRVYYKTLVKSDT